MGMRSLLLTISTIWLLIRVSTMQAVSVEPEFKVLTLVS